MTYTKQQLINAFCEATKYNPDTGTKAQHLAKWQETKEPVYQKQLASLKTPEQQAIQVALNYLLAIERENNKNVGFS